ncbi:MAG: SDR family oxidoreductase [Betaproteobacteria bacterium]|nr:SDR family oxidoreductase [Betaproteobacteria bacterium]
MKVLLVGGCGYIGSFLYERLIESGGNVTVSDTLARGNPAGIPVSYGSYFDLTTEDLGRFNAVLWFAGHSSVPLASQQPIAALENNCIELYRFRQRLPQECKFIYASTASLYSRAIESACNEMSNEQSLVEIPAQNPYDCSKFAFDYIQQNFLRPGYCLRMGTLAGFSQNLRPELLFNAMTISAAQKKVVYVRNSAAMRTILFLSDLWSFVKALLSQYHPPGVYNLGSQSASILGFAEAIAAWWGAEIVVEPDSPTYSFALDTSLMRRICGALELRTLGEMSADFMSSFQRN